MCAEMNYAQNKDELLTQGYTIVRGFFSPEECSIITQSFVSASLAIVFEGTNVDCNNPENLALFTDPALRKATLKNPNMVHRNGNSRAPLLSKSSGMIDIHFNPAQMTMVNFNPRLYELLAFLYGKRELSMCYGPERFSIKAQGATDMPKHIDANPFYPEVNYKERIQTVITLSIGEIGPGATKIEHSGTLFLIPYFHHYWSFFSIMFHPKTGAIHHPDITSRFFTIPTGQNGWDKYFLPTLRVYAQAYTEFLHRGVLPQDGNILNLFRYIKNAGIAVPQQMYPLEWTGMNVKAGDVICWNQYLPHYTTKNKCKVPRIACYYSVFPVERDWFGSDEQKWCAQMFREGKFFYGTDANRFPCNVRNIEEYSYFTRHSLIGDAVSPVFSSDFSQRIAGIKSWYN